MRSLVFHKGAKAAILSGAIIGCGGPQSAPLPPVVVEVPSANPVEEKPPVFPAKEEKTPTRMTLLLTGDVFLAYVSVPDGGAWRDKDDALSAFFYKAEDGWISVSGCEKAFTCDISAVRGANPGSILFKAIFIPESDALSPSEAEHRVQ